MTNYMSENKMIRGDCPMGKNYQMRENVFAPPFDMENGSAENNVKDAVASILDVCDQVEKQREAEKKAIAEKED